MVRKILLALLAFVIVYVGIGFVFHFKWKSALAACREMRTARGEFVEPEVFGGVLGLFFDVTNWPVYAWANNYHFGTPFATPCDHSRETDVQDEEGAVRYVVESFGKRLQSVSIPSPDAAQAIREQYAEWISLELLEAWTEEPSRAPGRIVSSPWPDHIEITALVKEGADRYAVTGFVVEITSVELGNGGAAAKIPVHLVVEKQEGRWLITGYVEER